jgi:Ca-activated chloride channel homolog
MAKTPARPRIPIVEILGILFLLGMITIGTLGLLGPAIGNVFSSITSNCCASGYSYSLPAPVTPYGGDGGYPTYGGTDPVNGEPYADVFFKDYGVNPFIDTEDDPLSTFALDVDTGSYTIARRYLADGYLPPAEAVRVEEFVNYFEYGEVAPVDGAFAVSLDGGPTPFVQNDRYQVIRVAIQGKEVDDRERRPAVLVIVIDSSGSMADGNRLGMVQASLAGLVETLGPADRVGVVAFDSQARVVLPVTPVSEREAILDAIYSLSPGDSTNAADGLLLGYQLADRAYQPGAINTVILCSDGVANSGVTGASEILATIRSESKGGIHLATVGFGMGNFNDVLMERLADEGDGIYAYVDNAAEAEKVFVENLTGTLQTIAMDAKVQVSFNPQVVSRYRLIGFENRGLRDEEFLDDTVDAGEVGAGQDVTALYEVKFHDGASGEIAQVVLRWEDPDTHDVEQLTESIFSADLAPSFEATSSAFQLAVISAEFAEILRDSYWAQERTLADVVPWLERLKPIAQDDEDVWEFIRLVERAASISGDA